MIRARAGTDDRYTDPLSRIDDRIGRGELREAIGKLTVRVLADNLGRGPTRVRTLLERDVVVCLLEDTMTKPERRLLDSGRASTVMEIRNGFHETMRNDLASGMEKLLGRRVRAVVAGTQLEPDITTLAFLLGEAHGSTS